LIDCLINLAVHGRMSNSQPVDNKSDVLTITLPNHRVMNHVGSKISFCVT